MTIDYRLLLLVVIKLAQFSFTIKMKKKKNRRKQMMKRNQKKTTKQTSTSAFNVEKCYRIKTVYANRQQRNANEI